MNLLINISPCHIVKNHYNNDIILGHFCKTAETVIFFLFYPSDSDSNKKQKSNSKHSLQNMFIAFMYAVPDIYCLSCLIPYSKMCSHPFANHYRTCQTYSSKKQESTKMSIWCEYQKIFHHSKHTMHSLNYRELHGIVLYIWISYSSYSILVLFCRIITRPWKAYASICKTFIQISQKNHSHTIHDVQ